MNFIRKSDLAPGARKGFSLVEVVVAVGIFAIAVISVIGLMVPINQSVANVKDGDDASRVASIIQNELQRLGIGAVNGFIGGASLYADRTGSKIGLLASTVWDTDVPDLNGNTLPDGFEKDAQKFFEIKVKASPSLPFTAASDGYLAINIEIRWPGYTADGNEFKTKEEQSILIVPAAITR
jgi:prepilin-type N-terminal cleavage/methylation domain-containing protein